MLSPSTSAAGWLPINSRPMMKACAKPSGEVCTAYCRFSPHALHMIVGIALLAVILWMSVKGRFSSEYYNPVEVSGLYWHFVDIVWIFLFPLLYLVGHHK